MPLETTTKYQQQNSMSRRVDIKECDFLRKVVPEHILEGLEGVKKEKSSEKSAEEN